MSSAFYQQIQQQIEEVKAEGLYKAERIITSQQQAAVKISTGGRSTELLCEQLPRPSKPSSAYRSG